MGFRNRGIWAQVVNLHLVVVLAPAGMVRIGAVTAVKSRVEARRAGSE